MTKFFKLAALAAIAYGVWNRVRGKRGASETGS
jgi:hypothetical protein